MAGINDDDDDDDDDGICFSDFKTDEAVFQSAAEESNATARCGISDQRRWIWRGSDAVWQSSWCIHGNRLQQQT